MPVKKLRVVEGCGPLQLRKSPDSKSPLYQEWLTWEDGEVFIPPAHMRVEKALERGIVVEVKNG